MDEAAVLTISFVLGLQEVSTFLFPLLFPFYFLEGGSCSLVATSQSLSLLSDPGLGLKIK